MEQLAPYFTDLGTLAALVIAVTAFINKLTAWGGWRAQLVSWLVALLLALVGKLLSLGILAGAGWVEAGLWGVAAAAVANRVFTQEVVQAILEFLRLRLPKIQRVE